MHMHQSHEGHVRKQYHEEYTKHNGKEVEVVNYLTSKLPEYDFSGDNDGCGGIIADILEIVSSPDHGHPAKSPVSIAVNVGNIDNVDAFDKILFCEKVLRRCLVVAPDSFVDIASCGCVIVTCTVRPSPEDLPPAPGLW